MQPSLAFVVVLVIGMASSLFSTVWYIRFLVMEPSWGTRIMAMSAVNCFLSFAFLTSIYYHTTAWDAEKFFVCWAGGIGLLFTPALQMYAIVVRYRSLYRIIRGKAP